MVKKTIKKKSAVKSKPVTTVLSENLPVKPPSKFPKKLVLITVILVILAGLIYSGRTLFVAAIVNGQPVSRLSVVKALEKQAGQKTLEVIVLKSLINQEAKKKKVSVSQEELDKELEKIEKNVSSQGMTLEALLAQQGMTKDTLAEEIRLQILITKMVGENPSVSEGEIDDYMAAQKEQFSLSDLDQSEALSRDEVKKQIQQQKLQENIQSFIAKLKADATIKYWVQY